jgi:hypothetical protein
MALTLIFIWKRTRCATHGGVACRQNFDRFALHTPIHLHRSTFGVGVDTTPMLIFIPNVALFGWTMVFITVAAQNYLLQMNTYLADSPLSSCGDCAICSGCFGDGCGLVFGLDTMGSGFGCSQLPSSVDFWYCMCDAIGINLAGQYAQECSISNSAPQVSLASFNEGVRPFGRFQMRGLDHLEPRQQDVPSSASVYASVFTSICQSHVWTDHANAQATNAASATLGASSVTVTTSSIPQLTPSAQVQPTGISRGVN